VARLLGQRSKFRKVDVSWRSKAKERGRELGLCLGEAKAEWGSGTVLVLVRWREE
jgi:hypothetical protein